MYDGALKRVRPRVTPVGTAFEVVRILFALAAELPGGGWGTFPGEAVDDNGR